MLARMSKKALALLMVFCMVVSALSISALAIELPNGEDTPGSVDLRMFEYHVTYSALEELKDYYGYEGDVESVTIVFKQDFSLIEGESRRMINNLVAQCYSISFSMTRYDKAGPNEIKQFDIEFGDGTVLSVPESDLACTLITEQGAAVPIYEVSLKESLRPTDPTPEEGESVYVYLKAVDDLGEDNGRGYITVGEIKMDLPDANAEYRTGGEERYTKYADEISAALANIARYNNNTIDLSDVAWYTLHCASGADGYVENQEAWHLDGKVRVYNVNYHHNNGTEAVTTDPNGYMAGESFTTMTIEGLTYKGHTLLGWSTDPKATTPATSFSIPADGGDVDLYAVWKLDEPQPSTYTVTYKYEGDVPDGYTAPVDGNEYAKDAEVTVSTEPSHEPLDYSFSGWTVTEPSSGITITDGKFTMPEGNVTLTGTWTYTGTEPEPSTYTVTYKYEGDVPSGYTAPVDNNKYAKDAEVIVSTEPTTIPANYTFSGWKAEGITITDGKFAMPEDNVILTGTWTYTDPGSNPGPSYDYYRVTVNYLDRADGSKIAESYVSPSHIQGSRYDVSEYDAIAIEGYTYDATEGDAVSGILNGNKTVNVYYMADETDIDDGDTPTTDLPDVPGEGDGGETDIGDGQTPTTDLPDTGDNGGETDIPDSGTPTGSLPQTGTLAQTSAARLALGALALTASVAAAGLALLLFRKSRKA